VLGFGCCSCRYSRWSVVVRELVVDGSCACAGGMMEVIEIVAESGGLAEE
jgi:hypothetical protein